MRRVCIINVRSKIHPSDYLETGMNSEYEVRPVNSRRDGKPRRGAGGGTVGLNSKPQTTMVYKGLDNLQLDVVS